MLILTIHLVSKWEEDLCTQFMYFLYVINWKWTCPYTRPLLLHYDIHNFGKAFLLTDFRGNALILFASYIYTYGYEYGGFYRNIMHFYNVTDKGQRISL